MVIHDSYFKVLGLVIFCLPVRFTLQLSNKAGDEAYGCPVQPAVEIAD